MLSSFKSHITRNATLTELVTTELFDGVAESYLKLLLESSRVFEIDAHQELLPTRDEVDYLYVILSGFVGIWMPSFFDPQRENFVAWRGPGQIVGEMRTIGDFPAITRISTCEPCTILELRSDTLTDIADSSPAVYRNISRLLIKKMRQDRHRLEVIRSPSSAKRTVQTLLYLALERKTNDGLVLRIQKIPGLIMQDEIAAYIGSKRETVNRNLRKLRKQNLISYERNKNGSEITILDYQQLLNLATSANKTSQST